MRRAVFTISGFQGFVLAQQLLSAVWTAVRNGVVSAVSLPCTRYFVASSRIDRPSTRESWRIAANCSTRLSTPGSSPSQPCSMDQHWSGATSNRHKHTGESANGATANRPTGAKSNCHRHPTMRKPLNCNMVRLCKADARSSNLLGPTTTTTIRKAVPIVIGTAFRVGGHASAWSAVLPLCDTRPVHFP